MDIEERRLTVADSFGGGRVRLAGDAVHQVPPTGGYGMTTGAGDAVGLEWTLAAQIHGWGAPKLLAASGAGRPAKQTASSPPGHRSTDAAASPNAARSPSATGPPPPGTSLCAARS
ncbi:FAD-dependent monooxygenase [Nocardia kruczakiae]|uniref:FAD-dependent monooxygenase n=1 Tax=Nocardia kruczakiae TaxID=261477 RepID=UPI001FE1CFC9|nr:FAD-dependent monooxygenase [Nocardia kruczakiae]